MTTRQTIIFTAVFAISSVSFAAATCPSQTDTVAICKSTPQKGDQEVAASVFDSIAVCAQDSTTSLVLEKNGQSEAAEAIVEPRTGATTYRIETSDVDFSLSITVGRNPKALPAKLNVNFKTAKVDATSTYTCAK